MTRLHSIMAVVLLAGLAFWLGDNVIAQQGPLPGVGISGPTQEAPLPSVGASGPAEIAQEDIVLTGESVIRDFDGDSDIDVLITNATYASVVDVDRDGDDDVAVSQIAIVQDYNGDGLLDVLLPGNQ